MSDLPGTAPLRRLAMTPVTPSDEALLDDVRAGRDRAFAQLYERHHRVAAGVARRIVGGGPAAEDVVADAFTSLLAAVRAGRGPSANVRSYLLTSVRNAAIGYLRSQRRTVPAEAAVIDRPHHDADVLVQVDDQHRVKRAFAALPARWRHVLWYTDVHDLAPAVVGLMLGISPNAVSSLARRARERLRREYLQAHQDRVASGCEDYVSYLARYVEETLAAPVQHRVELHVLACAHCTTAVEQMRDLKHRMRAILLPLGLPVAAAVDPRDQDEPHEPQVSRSGRSGTRSRDVAGTGTGVGVVGAGALLALSRRAAALGTRWWWVRPRGTRRALFLTTPVVAISLLILATVASSDVLNQEGGVEVLPGVALQMPGHGTGLDTGSGQDVVPGPNARPGLDRAPGADGDATPAPDPRPIDVQGRPETDGSGGSAPPPDPSRLGDSQDGSSPVGSTTPPGSDVEPEPTAVPGPDNEPVPGSQQPPESAPEPRLTPKPLVLEVEHDDLGDLVPGRPGMLGATVSNPNPDATDAVAVDVTLPPGVVLDPAGSARAFSPWSCAPDAASPSGLACTVDAIAAGARSTALLPVLVAPDVAEGTVALRLDVRGDGIAPAGVDGVVPVSQSALAARYVATGDVDVAQVGAPVLHCAPLAPGCSTVNGGTATGGLQSNNRWNMVPVDELGTGTGSSTARLDIPAAAQVLAARLYWAGSCQDEISPVRVAPPGGTPAAVGDLSDLVVDRSGQAYQASVDVTDLVRAGGPGTWGVADVCATPGTGQWAGWALVVVHRAANADPADSADSEGIGIVYDGLLSITTTEGDQFVVAGRPGTTARVGIVAWDGDRGGTGDQVLFDDTPFVPLRWDGSRAAGVGMTDNALDSTAWGSSYANALGVDVRPFAPVTLASRRAAVGLTSTGDFYTVGVVTIVTGR